MWEERNVCCGEGDVPKVILSFVYHDRLWFLVYWSPQGLPALASGHSMMHILV